MALALIINNLGRERTWLVEKYVRTARRGEKMESSPTRCGTLLADDRATDVFDWFVMGMV
jgi:hypothetical protein